MRIWHSDRAAGVGALAVAGGGAGWSPAATQFLGGALIVAGVIAVRLDEP